MVLSTQGIRRLIMLALIMTGFILLTSCSHFSNKNDSAPKFYVDETRIPNAVPKIERRAKYGNYKSYVVFGKRYHVLPTSQNYNQIGTASWYGMKFHKRKTSSGEPYDILKMTAAHKTLPLPCYVEVTNLKNHKTIIVKVNDRGPFASDRIIDLSYVAAKKLGMIGHGTARVRVRTIGPSSISPVKVEHHYAASQTTHVSYLQVGAFQNQENALRFKNRLHTLISAPINIHQKVKLNSLYYVTVGPFHDANALSEISARLKQLGIDTKRIV